MSLVDAPHPARLPEPCSMPSLIQRMWEYDGSEQLVYVDKNRQVGAHTVFDLYNPHHAPSRPSNL